MATDHNFKVKNGLSVGNTEIIDSLGNIGAGGAADSSYDLKVHGLARFEGVANFTNNLQVGGLTVITSARNMQNIGNLNIGGYYAMDGVTIIDTSKNLTNIGTISSGAITSSGSLDVVNSSADSLIRIAHGAANTYDALLQFSGSASDITTEGAELWYDNGVGDFHIATTYNSADAAIRFHTRTAASKSTSNERFTITGDGNLQVADGKTLTLFNSSATSGGSVHLPRAGGITFYGNSDYHHGIVSRNVSGTSQDDIRINSYADVVINLDSNNNNSADADLIIGRHGSGTGTVSQLHRISGEQGTSSSYIGSNATYSRPLLEITTSATPTQIKITTNILYSGSGASTHAHSVTIRGFQYGSAQMADLQIGWHVYNNEFYNRTVVSSGSWAPTVTLAVENNKVVIHLASPGYWPKLYVESMYNAYGGSGQAIGWSWADAAISADANTPNQTVPYKSDFGNGVKIDSSGNFKVGSTTVINSNRRLTPAGIQMSADTGLYATNATLSYYSASNAVYLNGAGPSGWLRLNAAGSENDTNAINIFGSTAGANITFKTAGTQRMNIDSSGNLRWGSANTVILDASRNLSNIGTISSGEITSSGIAKFQRDVRSAGQVRATGWWNDAASTDYNGFAFEIGVSGGSAFALAYNRNTSTYGSMQFNANDFTFNNNIKMNGGYSFYMGTTSRFSSDNNGGFGINYGTTAGTATASLSIYNNTTATSQLFRDGSATFSGNVIVGNSANISMDANGNGQFEVEGSGYRGAIALDGNNMNIYHNSASRGITLGVNEQARLTINSSGNATFSGALYVNGGTTLYSGLDMYSTGSNNAYAHADARDSGNGARLHLFNRSNVHGYAAYYENWYDGSNYHSIGADGGRWKLSSGLDLSGTAKLTPSGYVNAPTGHAALNIGRAGTGETRAIDLWGSWSTGESKSITANYSTGVNDIVGQINFVHQPTANSSGSSIRFGKLYHGSTGTTYTMELHSESTTLSYLSMNSGMVQLGQDSTYSSSYGVIGFGGRTNGYNRIFGRTSTDDGLFLAAATGRKVFVRSNGNAGDDLTLGQDDSYTSYSAIGFGSQVQNGYNRVFGHKGTGDGLYLTSATGRGMYFRVNGSGSNSWQIRSDGSLAIGGSSGTVIMDQSRNLDNVATAHITGFTHIGNATAAGYATDDGSWGSRLNVSSTVHSKIEVSQEANSMRSHWYAHTGQDSIKFGTSTNHDVEIQRSGTTYLELRSDRVAVTGRLATESSSAAFDGVTIGSSTQSNYSNMVWYSNSGNAQIWKNGASGTNWSGARALNIYNSNGIIGFHPSATEEVVKIDSDGLHVNKSGDYISVPATSTRQKISLYGKSDPTYAIGMQSSVTFGGLNDWAMTFQFNNEDDRGFWWGDSVQDQSQGAMALTTNGKLTVANSIRVGYGESDTTTPGAAYDLDINGHGQVLGRFYAQDGLLKTNRRITTAQSVPIGHFSEGDQVFALDTTWTDEELRSYFNSNNVSWNADSTAPGGYAVYINGNVNVGGAYNSGFPYIPVDQDDLFYMECWIKNAGSGQTHYMGSNEYNQSFSSLGGHPGSYGYWTMSNTNPGTSWTKVTGYIGGFSAGTVGTFENGTKYWTPMALFNYGAGSGTRACYISGWKVIRVRHSGNRFFSGNLTLGSGSSTGVLKLKTYNDAASEYHVYNYNDDTFRINYNGSGGDEMIMNSSGSVTFSGNVTAYSDERLKSNVETLDGSKVLEMRGVSFIKDGEAGSGVIAQELEKVAPELVSEIGDFKSVSYGNLTGYLIEAIKEQQQKIEKLEELVEKLISEK